MEEGEDYIINLSKENTEILNQLHRLHFFTISKDHYLKRVDKFEEFQPTKFIYSYFCFSTIFHYKWSDLKSYGQINKLDEDDKESFKIDQYLKFIFENISNENRIKFIENIKGQFSLDEINSMIDNSNISEVKNEKTSFKRSINYILKGYQNDPKNDVFINKIINIIRIIRDVRNNVFHGSKDILQMTESKQQERLLFYSNFINSINKQFFIVITNITNIQLLDIEKKEYRIKWK